MYIAIWYQNPDRYESDLLVENGETLSPQASNRTDIIQQMSTIQETGKIIYKENDRLFVSQHGKRFLIRFRTQTTDEFNRKLWSSILIDTTDSNTIQHQELGRVIQETLESANLASEFSSIEKSINIISENTPSPSNTKVDARVMLVVILLVSLLFVIGILVIMLVR